MMARETLPGGASAEPLATERVLAERPPGTRDGIGAAPAAAAGVAAAGSVPGAAVPAAAAPATAPATRPAAAPRRDASLRLAYVLLLFGGWLGLHMLYLRRARAAVMRAILSVGAVVAVEAAFLMRGRLEPDATTQQLQQLGVVMGLAVALAVAIVLLLLLDAIRLPWLVRARNRRG